MLMLLVLSTFVFGSYGSSGENDGSLGKEEDLDALGDYPGQHVGLLFLEFNKTPASDSPLARGP